MNVASRTPDGQPSRCPLCGASITIEFSEPPGDAACPKCGSLVWKSMELLDGLRRIVADSIHVSANDRSDQAVQDFLELELHVDSLDVVELAMVFESEFGITFPEHEFQRMRTFGDLFRSLERRQRNPRSGLE